MEDKFFYYTGAIHIHTKFSDGTGDINEVSKAARAVGLDWIIITDHNSLDIEEGFFNGVCVIRGEEVSPSDNHYLALGIKDCIRPDNDPQKFIEEVRNQGGFGYAAHPGESDLRKNKARPIKWLDNSIIPDGVEIWNWFSDWADNYDETNIFKIFYSYIFRHNLIKGPCTETVKWWDDLNKNSGKIVPAIGGVDAHALKVSKYILPVKIFPYKSMFKTLANIIILKEKLPKDFEQQKNIILNSLKNGNNIIINRHLRDEIPFISVVDNYILVRLAVNAQIRIILDGFCIHEEYSKNLKFKTLKNGKYRVEIYLKNKPWIYTNPVFVDL